MIRHKQAEQWARLYRQVQAAEARQRQAEQETSPSPTQPPEFANSAVCTTQPPEYAKQQAVKDSEVEAARPVMVGTAADGRQAQLRAVSSELLYKRGGLKVLRQVRLPKWRGSFQWQIEAKIEALQVEHARLRAD